MDRRLFLSGALGVLGTAAVASALPRQAQALTAVKLGDQPPVSDILPNLDVPPETAMGEGIELVGYDDDDDDGRRRRRRRRLRLSARSQRLLKNIVTSETKRPCYSGWGTGA
jgi:hypothetical protein